MKIIHRYNSEERQHFFMNQGHSFKVKPKLLYSGILSQQKGWKDILHIHNFAEILFVSKGRGQIICDDKTYGIERGDIIVYNAGQGHMEQSSDSDPLELLFIGLDKIEISGLPRNCLITSETNNVLPTGDMEETFAMFFSTVIDEMASKDTFYTEIAKNVCNALVMYLYRLINRYNNIADLYSEKSSLDDVLIYIDTHYLEQITLDEIATACHISKYYLSHMFSDIKKQTVMQYIIAKRLENAKMLLNTTNMTVESIAFASGFNNTSYFSRAFKEQYGVSPLSYRKKNFDKIFIK